MRRQVIGDLGGFYRGSACDSATKTLGIEKNPEIVSAAIRNLAGYARPEVQDAPVPDQGALAVTR